MVAFNFLLGWAIVFTSVWVGLKYEGSRALIYYLAWLLIVLNLVAHYSEVAEIFTQSGLTPEITAPSGSAA